MQVILLEVVVATMAKYRFGRVVLHLLCVARGSDCRMHLAGVMREFLPGGH